MKKSSSLAEKLQAANSKAKTQEVHDKTTNPYNKNER
jgi:hypothetical protein